MTKPSTFPNEAAACPTTLGRIAQGDDLAVKQFIDTNKSYLHRFTHKHLNRSSDAEDLMQDIFIDIWRSAHRFDPHICPEYIFIMLIARRRMIDFYRKQSCTPSFENIEETLVEGIENKNIYSSSQTKKINSALNQLSFNEKQVITLHITKGLSHQQVANHLDIPLGSVKSHINRGLKKLKSLLSH